MRVTTWIPIVKKGTNEEGEESVTVSSEHGAGMGASGDYIRGFSVGLKEVAKRAGKMIAWLSAHLTITRR